MAVGDGGGCGRAAPASAESGKSLRLLPSCRWGGWAVSNCCGRWLEADWTMLGAPPVTAPASAPASFCVAGSRSVLPHLSLRRTHPFLSELFLDTESYLLDDTGTPLHSLGRQDIIFSLKLFWRYVILFIAGRGAVEQGGREMFAAWIASSLLSSAVACHVSSKLGQRRVYC